MVVACNHGAALEVGRVFIDERMLWRSGKDGADLALLDILKNEDIANRFSEVVVGSGDGIFAEIVARLAANGVRGHVVSRREALAHRLRMVVGGAVTYFVPLHQPIDAVACAQHEVA